MVEREEKADSTVGFSGVGVALGEEREGAVGEGKASGLASREEEADGATVTEAGGDVDGVVEGGSGGGEGMEAEEGAEEEESAGTVVPEAFQDGVDGGR